MKPAFTFPGCKRRVAKLVWERLGNVAFYVEPFAATAAALLARPTPPRNELLGNMSGFISNFWRAAKFAPDDVAMWCHFLPSEIDLHARHAWLLANEHHLEKPLRKDPMLFDAKTNTWFAWGASLWIRGGWCVQLDLLQFFFQTQRIRALPFS